MTGSLRATRTFTGFTPPKTMRDSPSVSGHDRPRVRLGYGVHRFDQKSHRLTEGRADSYIQANFIDFHPASLPHVPSPLIATRDVGAPRDIVAWSRP